MKPLHRPDRRAFLGIGAGSLCLTVPTLGIANLGYPQRPVKLLVGFSPGGFTDVIARAMAEPLSAAFNQPFVVENVPGAAGTIAAAAVARSVADGHTLLMGHVTANAAAPAMMPRLPYDPIKAFAPITLTAQQPHVLAVHPSLKVTSVAQFVEKAKREPGRLAYASSGNGSLQHLAGELFKQGANVDLVHVPYKGSGPALNDLLGGQVHVCFDGLSTLAPHLKSGSLTPLAVTTATRAAVLPELPTLAESGLVGYAMSSWFGLFAPTNTPAEVIRMLHRHAAAALRTERVIKVLAQAGATPGGQSPDEFSAFVRNEAERLAVLIKASRIVAE